MYRNARAEMVRAGLTLADLSRELGGTMSTWSLKLNGRYPITLNEAIGFKKLVKSVLPIEELFAQFVEGVG